jgi:hypothetical protein
LDPTFEEVAFALQPSTTGNPIIGEAKTPFGYHIIMVSFYSIFPRPLPEHSVLLTLDCLGRRAQVSYKERVKRGYMQISQDKAERASNLYNCLNSVFLLFPSCNVAMIQGLEYNPKGKVVFLRVLKRNQDRTSIPH